MINVNLKYYKQKVTFGFIFIICFILVLMSGGQIALMHVFEDENVIWQGVCEGGALRNAGDRRTNMMVHCPGEEEFEINDPDVIVTYKDGGKVFYCRKTLGTILKDEDWSCNVTKEGED